MNERQVRRLQNAFGADYVETLSTPKGKVHIFDGNLPVEGDPDYPNASYRTLWILEREEDKSGRTLYFDAWHAPKGVTVPSDRKSRVNAAMEDAMNHLKGDHHA